MLSAWDLSSMALYMNLSRLLVCYLYKLSVHTTTKYLSLTFFILFTSSKVSG
jgi:hypothetical protein